MFNIALGLFLFLSPILFIPLNNARLNGTIGALQYYQFKSMSLTGNALQLQFFQYGVVLLLMIALMQKQVRHFQDKYLAWFLGLCVLSVILHPKTISAFIPILLGFLFYYLIVSYTKNIKPLLKIIVLVSALNTIFAVLQFFNIYPIYHPTGSIFGLMYSPSHLGAYQALALPICYALNPVLVIIPLIGLFLSKSFTPILAGAVGMAYFLFPKRIKIFINLAPMGLIILFVISAGFIIRNYANIVYKFTLRLGMWKDTFADIIRNPLGNGLGTFFKTTSWGVWDVPQNEYLGIAFSVGILSWFFIYGFLKDKFTGTKENLHRAVTASCLIVAVICLGQSPMEFARLTGTIIPLFAFLAILKRLEVCH
jgi:hypothetical protein